MNGNKFQMCAVGQIKIVRNFANNDTANTRHQKLTERRTAIDNRPVIKTKYFLNTKGGRTYSKG